MVEIPEAHPDTIPLMAAVGEALSAWSEAESIVSFFFAELSGMPSAHNAHIIMATVQRFEIRLQICNALIADQELPAGFVAAWHNVFNRLTRHMKRRNELAHFQILKLTGDGKPDEVRLVPYFSYTSKGARQPHLSWQDVQLRTEKFHEVAYQMMWLFNELRVLKGELPENPLQEPRPGRLLRTQDGPAHEGTAHPPEPSRK
jgi:hypothetical protein